MEKRAYMPQAKTVEWETPQELFDALNQEFDFTLDPCATAENAKCEKFYTKEDNGLLRSWDGERVYLNPPYGRGIEAWIEKAYLGTLRIIGPEIVVALLPARTGNKWFHKFIWKRAEIRFLSGRVKYSNKGSAPFDSMIVIWKRRITSEA